MALYSASAGGIDVAALATRTTLQVLAGAQEQFRLRELSVSTDRFDAVKPLLVSLVRQTTAGTMTALTPKLDDPADGTPDATASHSATGEPTTTETLRSWWVPSTQGLFLKEWSLGSEIKVAKAGRLGLLISNQGAATVSPICTMAWEEEARYHTATPGVVATNNAIKTTIQLLAGAQDRMEIVEIGIGFDGSTAVPPAAVKLSRQTTAGSGGTAITPANLDSADGTPAATALHSPTSEPTTTDTVEGTWSVPVNNGNQMTQLPLGDRIIVQKGERIGLVYFLPVASGTPTMRAYIVHKE